MSKRRKIHHGSILFLVILLSGVLAGGCGVDEPTGKTARTAGGVVSGSTATIGMKLCTSCHSVQAEEWLTSKHGNVDPVGNLYSAGVPTIGLLGVGDCARCHDPQGDSGELVAGYTGNTVRPVVGCESCHGGGEKHYDLGGAGYIGFATLPAKVIGTTSTVRASAQFRTCTVCHELLDPLDPASTTTATTSPHDLAGAYPLTLGDSITDTHFATPGDFTGSNGANVKDITGYAMDFSNEKVCSNCHNPHLAPDRNREWAQSAHADRNAAATGYFSGAWAHYDWSNRGSCQRCKTTTGFSAYADALRSGDTARAAEISEGTIPALAFSATPSFKPEMLQCWGCHTDNKGTRRNPGRITADYSYSSSGQLLAIASHIYPDSSDSNICLTCHTGQESGETLYGLNDPALLSAGSISATDFSNRSFVNSHYLTAGGTVFRATGFEFPGRSYENLTSYRHYQIGTSALPFSGSGGPCVGCHMSRPGGNGDHLFLPVTRSSTSIGHIDSIASEVCIYCHTVSGAGGLEDLINERKEEYHEALLATMYVLDKRGFYFRASYPYFFNKRTSAGTVASITATTVTGSGVDWSGVDTTDYFKMDDDGEYYLVSSVTDTTTIELSAPYTGTVTTGNYVIIRSGGGGPAPIKNWLTQAGSGITPAAATDADTTGSITGRYNLGAAFNLNLMEHDPGAYVHNRMYAKRLLYDAIDWADDNAMNYSTGSTLNNLSATAKYKAGAMKYLLPYGVLGIPAERP